MRRRVFGIGLDGATFDLLDPWLEGGELPVLRSILQRGVRGRLESTVPPMSPQAWTSFMTGKNPGKHGVYDFIQPRPGSYELDFCNASTRRADSIWKILSDAGRTVGAVNVPMTYPPEPVNGFIVSGMEAPGVHGDFTFPPELGGELKQACGGYDMHGDYWTRCSPEEYLERVLATVDSQAGAIAYLMERYDWDLMFAVFGSTDRVQHFFWHYIDPSHPRHDPAASERLGDAVLRVYRRVDEWLGRFLDLLPEGATLFLMSDHGAGPFEKIVHLDTWLHREGYLAYRDGSAAWSLRSAAFGALKRAYLAMRKLLPRSAKDLLKGALPGVRGRLESHLMTAPVDWRRTRAFYLGIESTRIFVNLKGRFPLGTVEPGDEYERLRDEIIAGLQELRDPDTGEPLVERAARGEEVYWGGALDDAPDILVLWREQRYITRKGYGMQATERPETIVDEDLRFGEIGQLMGLEQTGTHRPDGIFHLQGQGIRDGAGLDGARITDLAPTLLYLLDVPVPLDMDGRVLTSAVTAEHLEQHPIRWAEVEEEGTGGRAEPSYSEKEARAIGERLRNLGYIE